MLSVIIPTWNEAARIGPLIEHLRATSPLPAHRIVVSDGGSTDATGTIAERLGATFLASPRSGRAGQMNYAAERSDAEVLYFVHADCTPPASWYADIQTALAEGYPYGLFSYRFDSSNPLLRINERFVRFDNRLLGGGDQTFFIRRDLFRAEGMYRECCCIMEDFDFFWRIKRRHPFKLILNDVTVSARKYEVNSWLRVQLANLMAMTCFRTGWLTRPQIKQLYRRMLRA